MGDVSVRCLALGELPTITLIITTSSHEIPKAVILEQRAEDLVKRRDPQDFPVKKGICCLLASRDRTLPPSKESHDEVDLVVRQFSYIEEISCFPRIPPLVPAPPGVSRGQLLSRL